MSEVFGKWNALYLATFSLIFGVQIIVRLHTTNTIEMDTILTPKRGKWHEYL